MKESYKPRIVVWVVVIIVYLIFKGFSMLIDMSEFTYIKANIESFGNGGVSIGQYTYGKSFGYLNNIGNFALEASSKDADLVIAKEILDSEKKSTDILLDDFLYSPMVVFTSSDIVYNDSGFNYKNDSYYINLKSVLIGIEDNLLWKDIGIKLNKLKDENITLKIPDKSSIYYENVRELIAINLVDYGKPVTKDIYDRADEIMEKCISVPDIMQEIRNDIDLDKIYVYIAPEYIMVELQNLDQTRNNIIPVYPELTCALYLDVLINNSNPEIADNIKSCLYDSDAFYKNSYLRNSNGCYPKYKFISEYLNIK